MLTASVVLPGHGRAAAAVPLVVLVLLLLFSGTYRASTAVVSARLPSLKRSSLSRA